MTVRSSLYNLAYISMHDAGMYRSKNKIVHNKIGPRVFPWKAHNITSKNDTDRHRDRIFALYSYVSYTKEAETSLMTQFLSVSMDFLSTFLKQ